jgi:hypothetical protein
MGENLKKFLFVSLSSSKNDQQTAEIELLKVINQKLTKAFQYSRFHDRNVQNFD